uniref:Uncharacterized protein n=1 Tax=Oryza barthii TaxID=65489 RepID=A0A0D3GSE2_9ORYZ
MASESAWAPRGSHDGWGAVVAAGKGDRVDGGDVEEVGDEDGGGYPTLVDTSTADFDRTFAVNTRGAFLCLREAAHRLPRGGGGRIVAITSSVVGSHPTGYSAYTASKAAVEAMMRTMAKELKGTRITANCVAPGATATDMFFAGKSEERVDEIKATNPMGRLGEAGDIAPVVGFLCTDAAEWVNGQVIRVNGGYV